MEPQEENINDDILSLEGSEDLTLQQDMEAVSGLTTFFGKPENPDLLQEERAKNAEALEAAEKKYIYLLAEFENYKRRVQKEQADQAKFANEKLLKEMLVLIDDLERAIAHSRNIQDPGKITEGVELILKQFLSLFSRQGVTPIESMGTPFNPEYHQAVGYVERPEAVEHQVAEEVQKGYMLHSRVLRAAMVLIAQKKVPLIGPVGEVNGGLGEAIDTKV